MTTRQKLSAMGLSVEFNGNTWKVLDPSNHVVRLGAYEDQLRKFCKEMTRAAMEDIHSKADILQKTWTNQ